MDGCGYARVGMARWEGRGCGGAPSDGGSPCSAAALILLISSSLDLPIGAVCGRSVVSGAAAQLGGVGDQGGTPRAVALFARLLQLMSGCIEVLEELVVVSDQVADLCPPFVQGFGQDSDCFRVRGVRRRRFVQLMRSSHCE